MAERPAFMDVARSLALQEARVLRCYAKAGKVLIAPSGPMLDQALVCATVYQEGAHWQKSLLPTKTAPLQHAS